jgi:hypothetical protein
MRAYRPLDDRYAKHACLQGSQTIREQNWDLDFMVVMPGEAGKQLFKEHPLSDQSVVARAYGRIGDKAKGVPNTGGKAKGVPNTGRAAKGAANWRTGKMQTPQDLLLAFQQEVLGL